MNKYIMSTLSLTLSLIVLHLATLVKVNLLLGSQEAVLSGFSMCGPLIGLYTGGILSLAVFLLKSLFYGIFNPWALLSPLVWNLPTLSASLYWTGHKFFKLFLPLICMVLFVMHPVGSDAMEYALFWLIPVLVYFLGTENLFAQALGSTFVAHAVGSVLWLYCVPMTSQQWLSLIPMVIVERLLIASGMVIVCSAISLCSSWFKKFSFISGLRRA